MMFTTQMTQLFAVVLAKDKERVTEALLREGVLQFISTLDGQEMGPLSAPPSEESLSALSDLRKRIEGILHTVGIVPAPPQESDLKRRIAVDTEKEKAYLDKIDGERESIRDRQRVIQQEVLKLEDIRRQVGLYGVGLAGVKLPKSQSMLSLQTGKLSASGVRHLDEGLKGLPALHLALGEDAETGYHLLVFMKRDRKSIDKILSQAGWTDVELPQELVSGKKDLAGELTGKLRALGDEQKKLQNRVTTLIKKDEKPLLDLWSNLRINELCYKIQANFKSSSRTAIFVGWLPSSKEKTLHAKIEESCEGRCYLEWHEAGSRETIGDDVPIQFNNPKVLAPFQMLVSNFGIPQYGTIDPTPFVMPVYLAMFGLMFADVGQGLVLALLGALGVSRFKKQQKKQGLYQLSWLVIWCGFSSMVFGALLGSYFGMALFDALWFDFHGIVSGHGDTNSVIGDIYDVLAITLYFGIFVIAVGLLFNWINLIRTRNWMELCFDKGGLLGGWIYGGGIVVAYHMITHEYKELPPGQAMFLLVGLPALLLLIKEPYHYFKHESGSSDPKRHVLLMIPNFLMQWIVELLEIFSGYLSNTLSFLRIAGLGIAHVCLMISFFTLARMTSGIFSILILILGNILVIGLEGLSAGIQALRLNYYEFFTKFFHGTGKLHTPISLNSER